MSHLPGRCSIPGCKYLTQWLDHKCPVTENGIKCENFVHTLCAEELFFYGIEEDESTVRCLLHHRQIHPTTWQIMSPISQLTDNSKINLSLKSSDEKIGNHEEWGDLIKPSDDKKNRIWKFFMVYSNPKGIKEVSQMANCIGCNKDLKLGADISPTPLDRHAAKCQKLKEIYGGDIQDTRSIESKSTRNYNQTKLTDYMTDEKFQLGYRKLCAKLIVTKYLPLNIVTDEVFRELVDFLSHKHQIQHPGKDGIKKIIAAENINRLNFMKELLHDRPFSITHDSWTSSQNLSYLAVTIHIIDNEWILHHHPLACTVKDGRSTAKCIYQQLQKVLKNYDLRLQSLTACTTDTEAVMQSVARLMKTDVQHIIFNPCAAHTIELTTKKARGTKKSQDPHLQYWTNLLEKCRRLVVAYKNSPILERELEKEYKRLNRHSQKSSLIMDVATRWWSTHSMLERLLEFRVALSFVYVANRESMRKKKVPDLTDDEWTFVEQLNEFLIDFRRVQQSLEGEKYVTISLIPNYVHGLRLHLGGYANSLVNHSHIRALAKHLLQDFNERYVHSSLVNIFIFAIRYSLNLFIRWGNGTDGTVFAEHQTKGTNNRVKGLSLACMWGSLLDPRTKNFNPFCLIDKVAIENSLKEECLRLTPATAATEQSLRDNPIQNEAQNEFEERFFYRFAHTPAPADPNPQQDENAIDREYEQFSREAHLLYSDDPLAWWRKKADTYPNLARVARRILAIPATSASSERLFSAAGITIANDRANLLPEAAEEIILLRDFYRGEY